jgi:hypothetical protein
MSKDQRESSDRRTNLEKGLPGRGSNPRPGSDRLQEGLPPRSENPRPQPSSGGKHEAGLPPKGENPRPKKDAGGSK